MIFEAVEKKLRIFDFDDTLAKVKANIHVHNGDNKFILSPAEFAVYEPKKGDVFNFKEFLNEATNNSELLNSIRSLKNNIGLNEKDMNFSWFDKQKRS